MTARQARFLADEVMTDWHVKDLHKNEFGGGFEWFGAIGSAGMCWHCWDPSTSETDCAELLRAVASDKRDAVCSNLRQISDGPMYWFFLTATPAQITESVLAAYGYKEEEDGTKPAAAR